MSGVATVTIWASFLYTVLWVWGGPQRRDEVGYWSRPPRVVRALFRMRPGPLHRQTVAVQVWMGLWAVGGGATLVFNLSPGLGGRLMLIATMVGMSIAIGTMVGDWVVGRRRR